MYVILTEAGLILLGIALLDTGLQNWVGWMLIIGDALFLVLMIILGDLPPFVFYLLTLIAGIMIFRVAVLHIHSILLNVFRLYIKSLASFS